MSRATDEQYAPGVDGRRQRDRLEAQLEPEDDQPLVCRDDFEHRGLADEGERAAREHPGGRQFFRADQAVLLAEGRREPDVAPRPADLDKRGRLGEKVELGVSRAEAVDAVIFDRPR